MTLDMPRKMPLHVVRERSRHGRVMFFFRRGKGKRIRLPDQYPSPEFDAAYQSALSGEPAKLAPRSASPSDRLEWLVKRFMESAKWASTSPATRRQRELLYLSALKNGNPRFTQIRICEMATLSERLRKPKPGEEWCDFVDKIHEAADALDAMEAALEKAAKMLRLDNYIGPEETLDAFDDTLADIKAALAMIRK